MHKLGREAKAQLPGAKGVHMSSVTAHCPAITPTRVVGTLNQFTLISVQASVVEGDPTFHGTTQHSVAGAAGVTATARKLIDDVTACRFGGRAGIAGTVRDLKLLCAHKVGKTLSYPLTLYPASTEDEHRMAGLSGQCGADFCDVPQPGSGGACSASADSNSAHAPHVGHALL